MTEACVVKRNPGQSTAKIRSMEQAILTARKNPCVGAALSGQSPSLGMRIFHPELLSGGNRACPSPSMMLLPGTGGQRFAIVVGLGRVSPRHVISDGLVSWNFSLHRPRCCWPAFISRSSCTTIDFVDQSRPPAEWRGVLRTPAQVLSDLFRALQPQRSTQNF